MLLASTSDLDDLIPTLVAYQVEWNKLHAAPRAAERPPAPTRPRGLRRGVRRRRGGLDPHPRGLGRRSPTFLDEVHDRRLNLRIRMLGGSPGRLRAR